MLTPCVFEKILIWTKTLIQHRNPWLEDVISLSGQETCLLDILLPAVFSSNEWQLMDTTAVSGFLSESPFPNQFAGGYLGDERNGMRGEESETEGEKDTAGGGCHTL